MNNSPQQIVMRMMEKNTNPLISNLIKMAQAGNSGKVEEFARNICKERGKNFDEEFSKFMNNFK